MTPADELRALDDLALRLQGRFPDTPPEDLRLSVDEIHRQYAGCRIRAFIPVLVEREVVDRYRVPAPLAGAAPVPAPNAVPTAVATVRPGASRERSPA